MSNIALGGKYQGCMSSLRDTSLDDNATNVKHYMTKSSLSVYNFDMVKARYSNALRVSEQPKSVDALAFSANGDIYLIEFKNGDISNRKKGLEIRQEIYDSLIILYDLLGVGPALSRSEVVFVLVYNEHKNKCANEVDQSVSSENSRIKIANAVSQKANKSFVPYGLNGLRNFCLKDMKTVTAAEFDRDVVPLLV